MEQTVVKLQYRRQSCQPCEHSLSLCFSVKPLDLYKEASGQVLWPEKNMPISPKEK